MKGKSTPIIIGTRGSELALWQANFTKNELAKNGISAELKIIKTKGDATQQWNLSFDKIEGKGFFTKELEDALLANEIDLAVHSCKDLPTEYPDGLTIAAYSKRANPFDILLIKKESVDETKILKLKENAVVGTSSARRKAQLLAILPDIDINDLRGNVPTRVQKLKENNYDAIVLASAGLERLNINLNEFEKVELTAPLFIPAPAQGVLAFQIRKSDDEMKHICAVLNDANSFKITNIERKILHDFEGGCQIPLGVYAEKINNDFHVWISQAIAWNAFPKRMHFTITENDLEKKLDDLITKAKTSKASSVFISSELKDDEYISRALMAHHIPFHCESFLEFNALNFEFPTNADWLFFSSKNGVKYFFNAYQDEFRKSMIKLAAINQGTAHAIHELGFNTEFIGKGNDLLRIAEQFDAIADGKIVFPQASKSLQSIQNNLTNNKNTESLVVYENYPKIDFAERKESILVFTSPMSAAAYFSKYQIQDFQSVISIGNTTTKKIKTFNYNNVKTAFEPSFYALLDEIFSV
jgi:hydroxymethylbilane synthase